MSTSGSPTGPDLVPLRLDAVPGHRFGCHRDPGRRLLLQIPHPFLRLVPARPKAHQRRRDSVPDRGELHRDALGGEPPESPDGDQVWGARGICGAIFLFGKGERRQFRYALAQRNVRGMLGPFGSPWWPACGLIKAGNRRPTAPGKPRTRSATCRWACSSAWGWSLSFTSRPTLPTCGSRPRASPPRPAWRPTR